MEQNLDIYNEPLYNEVLVMTNTIEKPKLKIYPDITNKCHYATKDECGTDQQRWKSFNLVTRELLFSQWLSHVRYDTGTIVKHNPLYLLCLLLFLLIINYTLI